MKWFNVKRLWQIAAFALTVGGIIAVMLWPLFTVATQQGAGQTEVQATALEVEGPFVVAIVAIPLALTLVPLVIKHRGWMVTSYVCALGLIVFSFLARASIGMLFFPAALAALVAAFIQHPTPKA